VLYHLRLDTAIAESNKMLCQVIQQDKVQKAKEARREDRAQLQRAEEFRKFAEAAGQDEQQTTLETSFGKKQPPPCAEVVVPPPPPTRPTPTAAAQPTTVTARGVAFSGEEMHEKFMEKFNEVLEGEKATRGAKVPTSVKAMFEILIDTCVPKRFSADNTPAVSALTDAAMAKYNANFGSKLFYTVPSLQVGTLAHAHYHSIAGLRFYVVQWELRVPNIVLKCTKSGLCNGLLCHDRNEFKKNQRAAPMYGMGGQVGWVTTMFYKCGECGTRIPGNDPHLLASLPAYIRDLYPVDPRYASTKRFQLDIPLSKWAREASISWLSPEQFAKLLFEVLGEMYVARVENFVSLLNANKEFLEDKEKESVCYPSFLDWVGELPPSPQQLRNLLHLAERSDLTSSGVSDHDRQVRELQSVQAKVCFSFDHCFATAKTYLGSSGIKCTWNVTNENGETMSCLAVADSSAATYAHGAEQLIRREGFHPKVYYSDIFPSGGPFWTLLLGDSVLGRLGLFHFLQRIVRTLRDTHECYKISIKELKMAIYRYERHTTSSSKKSSSLAWLLNKS